MTHRRNDMEYLNVPIGERPPIRGIDTCTVEGRQVRLADINPTGKGYSAVAIHRFPDDEVLTVQGFGRADCLVKMRALLLAQQQP